MNDREVLPEIPEGYRQLDSAELMQPGDLRFSQYNLTWVPVQEGSVVVACSAGNTGIAVRKSGVELNPKVLSLRRATTKTHGTDDPDYRYLDVGETTQDGDEFMNRTWQKFTPGQSHTTVKKWDHGFYRRPVRSKVSK